MNFGRNVGSFIELFTWATVPPHPQPLPAARQQMNFISFANNNHSDKAFALPAQTFPFILCIRLYAQAQ